jgi:hypothetical protein
MGKKYHTVGTIPYVTLADFGYPVSTFGFIAPKTLKYLAFQSFGF